MRSGYCDANSIIVEQPRRCCFGGMRMSIIAEAYLAPSQANYFLHNRQLIRCIADLVVIRCQATGSDGIITHIAILRIVVRITQRAAQDAFVFTIDKAATGHAVICRLIAIGDGLGFGSDSKTCLPNGQVRAIEVDSVVFPCRQCALRDGIFADVLAFLTGQRTGQRIGPDQALSRIGQIRIRFAIGLRLGFCNNLQACFADREVLLTLWWQLVVAVLCSREGRRRSSVAANLSLCAGNTNANLIVVYQARRRSRGNLLLSIIGEATVAPFQANFFPQNRQYTILKFNVVIIRRQATGRDIKLSDISILLIVVRIVQRAAQDAFVFTIDKAVVGHAVICRRVAVGDVFGFCSNCQICLADRHGCASGDGVVVGLFDLVPDRIGAGVDIARVRGRISTVLCLRVSHSRAFGCGYGNAVASAVICTGIALGGNVSHGRRKNGSRRRGLISFFRKHIVVRAGAAKGRAADRNFLFNTNVCVFKCASCSNCQCITFNKSVKYRIAGIQSDIGCPVIGLILCGHTGNLHALRLNLNPFKVRCAVRSNLVIHVIRSGVCVGRVGCVERTVRAIAIGNRQSCRRIYRD